MDQNRWERWGAAAGVAFVVTVLLSTFVAPQPPHLDAPTSKIAAYYAGHTNAILFGGLVGVLAAVFFLWFLGHLRHVLQRAEGGAEAFSPIVFCSGVALAAVATLGGLPAMTLAFVAKRHDVIGAGVTRALWDMAFMQNNFVCLLAALFIAATSMAMIRREMLASWLGWAGLVPGAAMAVVGTTGFFVTGYNAAWVGLGFVAILGFTAWILVASVSMLQRPEVARATSRQPVFA
jgi:hypothetical protein